MSRIYVCDRCKKQLNTWKTTSIEIPAVSYWGKAIRKELCSECLVGLRKIVNIFLGEQNVSNAG